MRISVLFASVSTDATLTDVGNRESDTITKDPCEQPMLLIPYRRLCEFIRNSRQIRQQIYIKMHAQEKNGCLVESGMRLFQRS